MGRYLIHAYIYTIVYNHIEICMCIYMQTHIYICKCIHKHCVCVYICVTRLSQIATLRKSYKWKNMSLYLHYIFLDQTVILYCHTAIRGKRRSLPSGLWCYKILWSPMLTGKVASSSCYTASAVLQVGRSWWIEFLSGFQNLHSFS